MLLLAHGIQVKHFVSTSRHANSGANSGADPQSDPTQWIDDWLKAQQTWLAQWQQAAAAPPVAFDAINTFTRPFTGVADTAQVVEVLRSWQAWLQAPLAAGGQSFQAPSFWQQIMQAAKLWPGVRQSAWQAQHTAVEEYASHLQTVIQAHAKVFSQSLTTLQAQLQQGMIKPKDARELYDLWVAVGDQAFAQLAHDEAFIAAQAQMVNAFSRLQIARNAVLEEWLKAHDLPTRSELNGIQARLHDLHELTRRVAELERQLASQRRHE